MLENASELHFCSESDMKYESLERQNSTYDQLDDLRDSLTVKNHSYRHQYASTYYIRLLKIREALAAAAKQRWGSLPEKPKYVQKALDIQAGELCYILGTIYLEMPAKPNVMMNLEDEDHISKPSTPSKYKSDQDVISLEDESGRVEISGSCLDKEFLVTGTVVGILGKEVSTGAFEAIDICFPGMPEQEPLPKHDPAHPKYVALVSGLHVGKNDRIGMKVELLTEFLTGELGSLEDEAFSAAISRVILAGNSITNSPKQSNINTAKKYGYDSSTYNASSMLQLDEFLEDVCGTVSVDVMTGPTDPAPLHLPQQPMLSSMFKNSHRYNTFSTVTNPYWCKIEDITFLGTSGQNVDDIYRYVNSEDRLKMAESCMYWRHMAPSAPDTLWSYPFQDKDPFIVEESPHVYFIGNQPQFETSLLKGPNGQQTRIVLVPSFEETGVIILVNLSTLECKAVKICDEGMNAVDEDHQMDVSS